MESVEYQGVIVSDRNLWSLSLLQKVVLLVLVECSKIR
jgi:hypothetical protein